jgi:hypothetical protein
MKHTESFHSLRVEWAVLKMPWGAEMVEERRKKEYRSEPDDGNDLVKMDHYSYVVPPG